LAAGLDEFDPHDIYALDLLTGARPHGEARVMAESYVRMAGEIDRMNDLAFFAKYGEASLAACYLPEGPDEAGQKIFALCKRHARSVCHAFETAAGRHVSELRARDLPASSLLVAVISKHDEPAAPLLNLEPHEG